MGFPISIHALREEGDKDVKARGLPSPDISIHALREEGDDRGQRPSLHLAISIHALREEGDFIGLEDDFEICKFLSTPSARRATQVMSA